MNAVLRHVNAMAHPVKCPKCLGSIKPERPYAVFEVNGILVARCLPCSFLLCLEMYPVESSKVEEKHV